MIVEAASGPEFVIPPGTGGAPGRLTTPGLATVTRRGRPRPLARLRPEKRRPDRAGEKRIRTELVRSDPKQALQRLLESMMPGAKLQPIKERARSARHHHRGHDLKARQARQLHELDRHNQRLLLESADVRREFMKKLDVSSLARSRKRSNLIARYSPMR